MNILHYSLGFPPFRGGGMTKYCMDLMQEQASEGHKVGLLWPGKIKNWDETIDIKERKNYKFNNNCVCKSYEVINPLPVPLLDGIQDFSAYTKSKKKQNLIKFFKNQEYEIFHIHTLMGLPMEMLCAAKECDMKIVFTSHDYFGLCTRASLFYNGKVCEYNDKCINCTKCNKNALSLNKIRALQSYIYKKLKGTEIVKLMRKRHRCQISDGDGCTENKTNDNDKQKEYIELREFYIEILNKCDVLHFNSELTREVFSNYLDVSKKGIVINITHGSIVDKRKVRNVHDCLKMAFLGPCMDARKGFDSLMSILDALNKRYPSQFEIHVYGVCNYNEPYIKKHNNYIYSDMEEILNQIDVVICPSIWYETFGFTVLEALSFGIPVIVSDHVGAKDLIRDGLNGFVVNSLDLYKQTIESMINSKEKLYYMSRYIYNYQSVLTIKEHSKEIEKVLYDK